MNKEELISKFADKGCLLAPELVPTLEQENQDAITKTLEALEQRQDKPLILTNKFFLVLKGIPAGAEARIEIKQQPKVQVQITLKKPKIKKPESRLPEKKKQEAEKKELPEVLKKIHDIKILYTYTEEPKKINVDSFTSYYRNRFLKFREILSSRPELDNTISINKIGTNKEEFSVIGMVQEKRITKAGNVFLVLEDLTGSIKVIVSSRKKDLFDLADNLTYDEVVGVRGSGNNQFLFANEIAQTGVFRKERKKGGKGYAAFISDLHVGSNNFMEKELMNFIRWLNLETNGKHKEIAKQCKYLFVVGDIVDGVGIYPAQNQELFITDVKEQYQQAAYLLSQIRDDIKLIIIPGNHDATRLAVPQPVFDETFAAPLFKLKNAINLSNPAMVNIGSNEKFEGYDILLYHGTSLNYYANNIRSLINRGYKDPQLLLRYVLQRRHLSPTHGASPYVPLENDPLMINRIPDVFVTGELHKLSANYYNNVALITCSCWQEKTSFQAKVGHEPDPAKVPVMDLKSNTIKILDFS